MQSSGESSLGLTIPAELLLLGEGLVGASTSLIGHIPGRRIEDLTLRIGPRAMLRSGTVIYAGSAIGTDLQTGHNVVIREQNHIGDEVRIWNNTTIDYGCQIGNRVKIHTNCYIAQFSVLDDDVFLAPGVTIANDPHPGCAFSGICMRGPWLKHGVQVGVNVTILPMVTIGEDAVIAAGTVVVHDVPPRSLVVGNPGRITKRVDELTCSTGVAPQGYRYRPYVQRETLAREQDKIGPWKARPE
jgi:acetyltransferase-like isoleucine patch superfamily enzyme